MKIVFVAPFGIRPKGTVIARMLPLASELMALGHELVIIAPPYTNPEDSGREEVVNGVRLVNVILPRGGKVLRAPVLAYRMYRAVQVEHPDRIHLFKPKGYGGLAAMLHLLLRRPGRLLVDTDDWEGRGGMNELHYYSAPEKYFYAWQERWLTRHAAGVTVASRELARLTLGLGVPAGRICYLPNGVASAPAGDGSLVRKQWGISAETPVVLLYTRFFEFSQARLHQVLGGIYQQLPQVRFLVVGQGRRGEEVLLQRAAEKAHFAGALVMAGWVEPEYLPDYLAAADLALYPLDDNLVNRAKCPAKLTELLRGGVAVVADRVGQAAEYVQPGGGILCSPDDWQEMVSQSVRLLKDPDARGVLGATGRSRLLSNFNWRDLALIASQFYHECHVERRVG